ncbi:hypothetical protein QVD17_12641 [Tagetes erecta]|uniref:Uncharacterized protein n=1 Tax=Tagetes erecta TaxID=13708 RepID=A0AAD8KZR0_TARER|nr:hypothetical protein QVD17_12641 [Tagetes erecta]
MAKTNKFVQIIHAEHIVVGPQGRFKVLATYGDILLPESKIHHSEILVTELFMRKILVLTDDAPYLLCCCNEQGGSWGQKKVEETSDSQVGWGQRIKNIYLLMTLEPQVLNPHGSVIDESTPYMSEWKKDASSTP